MRHYESSEEVERSQMADFQERISSLVVVLDGIVALGDEVGIVRITRTDPTTFHRLPGKPRPPGISWQISSGPPVVLEAGTDSDVSSVGIVEKQVALDDSSCTRYSVIRHIVDPQAVHSIHKNRTQPLLTGWIFSTVEKTLPTIKEEWANPEQINPLSPVRALRRELYVRRLERTIFDLEQSTRDFETARHDPALNPYLAVYL